MRKLRIASLACGLALLAAPALAQDKEPAPAEPTLSETGKWLEESLPTKAFYTGKRGDSEITTKVIAASFNACQFSYETSEQVQSSKRPTVQLLDRRVVKFPLAGLDAAKTATEAPRDDFTPPPALLRLSARDAAKVVHVEAEGRGLVMRRPKEITATALVTIWFASEETAGRFERAFNHAIKLCQQQTKKEPF